MSKLMWSSTSFALLMSLVIVVLTTLHINLLSIVYVPLL